MPRRSLVVVNLPLALRERLDARLIEGGFGRYIETAAWLTGLGYPTSKSTLHRYGANLERKLKVWRAPIKGTAAGRIDALVAEQDTRRKNATVRAETGVLVVLIDPATRETITYATHHGIGRAGELIEIALSKTIKKAPNND